MFPKPARSQSGPRSEVTPVLLGNQWQRSVQIDEYSLSLTRRVTKSTTPDRDALARDASEVTSIEVVNDVLS